MKPVSEWNEDYIRQLPRGEFDWIEFKGRRGLDYSVSGIVEEVVLANLSVQLSAMANSGGGTIVYGMTDPIDLSERQVDDGGVALKLKGRNTKEWLEDVIPHLVALPLRRFSVLALTRESGAPNAFDGRGIIVIHVEDSREAPHQARDNRYYIRIGGKSKPAGHQFVSDIFHRGQHAELLLSFSIFSKTWIPRDPWGPPPLQGIGTAKPGRAVDLVVSAANSGAVFAQFMKCFIAIPVRLVAPDQLDEGDAITIGGSAFIEFGKSNHRRDVLGYSLGVPKFGGSWFDPILPGLSHTWTLRMNPTLRRETIAGEFVHWRIHADNAPALTGQTAFADVPFEIHDTHPTG